MWIKRYKHWLGVGAGILLGLIFVAAGVGKLLYEPEAFKIFFTPFPGFLSPIFTKAVFIWLPRIELAVGLLLITGIVAKLAATISSVLIVGFMVNNSLALISGLGGKPCGCFGAAERFTQATLSMLDALYLDIIMLVLVLIILFCYQGRFLSIYPWFLRRGKIAE